MLIIVASGALVVPAATGSMVKTCLNAAFTAPPVVAKLPARNSTSTSPAWKIVGVDELPSLDSLGTVDARGIALRK